MPTARVSNRLLSIREAVAVIEAQGGPTSERTLYRRMADGTVPVIQFGGRTLIDREDLNLVAFKRRRPIEAKGPAQEPSLSDDPPDLGRGDAAE